MRLTPRILDVLAESLEVYFRIFRRSAGQLLTVLVPMELVYALAVSWYCGGKSASAGPFGFLKTVMWLTAGLAVVSAVAEKVYRHCRGIEVWNDPEHGSGGHIGSWKRLMVTSWLQFLLVFVWVAVMVFSLVVGSCAVGSPLAELGGVAYGLSAVLGVTAVAAAVLAGLWFICRWIFAPVMSVVRPVSGFSALGMSADFVRGRILRCALFFVVSVLVVSGLTAVPTLAKDSLTSGVVPKDWLGVATFIMTEVAQDILGLYSVTALMVFWRRTEDAERGIVVKPPLRRSKILAVLLAGAGVAFLVWAVSAGVERHEREKRNPVQTVSWEEIKSLRAGSQFRPSRRSQERADEVLSRYSAGPLDGESLRAACDPDDVDDKDFVTALQERLSGRTLTFDVLKPSFNFPGFVLVEPKPTSVLRMSDESAPGSLPLELVFRGAQRERALQLEGFGFEEVSNVVAVACEPREMSPVRKSLIVEVKNFTLVAPHPVLSDFDAATITGEELQNLKGDGRYLLDRRQYVELQRRLVGRELIFAELTVSGRYECPISKAYCLYLHPLVGRVDLTARFETPEQETRARKVWEGKSSMQVKRLVGKVLPFDPSQIGHRGLFLSVVDIEWVDRPAPSVGSPSD